MRRLYIVLIAISGVYLLTQLRVWVYILIRCFSRHGGTVCGYEGYKPQVVMSIPLIIYC